MVHCLVDDTRCVRSDLSTELDTLFSTAATPSSLPPIVTEKTDRREGLRNDIHPSSSFQTKHSLSNMDNNTAEQEIKEEIRRVDSFEIEKPFISDNESEDGKKESSTVAVSSQALADYDARFLTLKQVGTQLLR